MSNPKYCSEINTRSHEQSQRCSEINTRSPPNRPRSLGNDTQSHAEAGKLWYHLLHPLEKLQTINPLITPRSAFPTPSQSPNIARTKYKRESKQYKEVPQLAYILGAEGRIFLFK